MRGKIFTVNDREESNDHEANDHEANDNEEANSFLGIRYTPKKETNCIFNSNWPPLLAGLSMGCYRRHFLTYPNSIYILSFILY